jgi:glutathione S-transferase
MKLYSNVFSPNCRRAIIAANELGIALETINIDFAKGDNKTPEYLAKNPMGKVPTLVDDDGYTLWESPAMLVYFAQKTGKLMPKDPRAMADTFRWMFWNSCHYEAAVFKAAMEKMIKPMMGGTPDESIIATAKGEYDRFAPVLNGGLEGKTWIMGNEFTIADIAVGVTVDLGTQCGFDPTGSFTHTTNWLNRLRQRPSWK